MDLKRRLLPIGIALAMIAVLFVSWTPNWESATWLRSEKPYVAFHFELPDDAGKSVENLAFDISNRLEVRHEWHRVEDSAAEWQVTLLFQEQENAVQIDATVKRQEELVDHIIVRGEKAVANELAGRIVDLLSTRIEKAHKNVD
ncbi:signaling protein [Idiomarina sp. HP20-50]|uniref:signaling protein n=1 Tax=Idiomarina sp. HP20-50 TaxID=3070813 RepID=UPI00294ACAFB|nr:signaling protein [Idiomarina sp. HP20-50]MDV6315853.1 signaling protein [Idiomarina sp. HP20-50]